VNRFGTGQRNWTPSRRADVVLVSGCTSGIGRACALALGRQGFSVFAGVRTAAQAEAIERESIENLTPVYLDVTHERSIRAAAEEIAAYAGEAGLKGLVNNAGITVIGPLEVLPMGELPLMETGAPTARLPTRGVDGVSCTGQRAGYIRPNPKKKGANRSCERWSHRDSEGPTSSRSATLKDRNPERAKSW
jgi:hypothetical protein